MSINPSLPPKSIDFESGNDLGYKTSAMASLEGPLASVVTNLSFSL